VWGVARRQGAAVLLRIEDHDGQRSRTAYDAAILEDLAWLGFAGHEGPVRQTTMEAAEAYRTAIDRLRAGDRVYACRCTRATFAAWAAEHARTWSGPGCPGACRTLALPEDASTTLRIALGDGEEIFMDELLGTRRGDPSADGDLIARDRAGNWTYGFAVVVDDDRQGVDLVIRGEDLLVETPRQIRLGRLLGRQTPPRYLHHPLIVKNSGAKLSKSDADTGVRELRAAGWSAARVRAEAATRGRVPGEVVEAAG
jgi:glutamyl-tRNA synthetase/glutamyl-Q tRNA(Asp) synthetase